MAVFRVPVATYRLQFNRQFRFEDAQAVVPFLEALGVTDLYASPLFQARKGSSHGYDVTDPTRFNQELGTEREFAALAQALKVRKMGLLLDIVPNHMALSSENCWWMNVLESGAGSPFVTFFDIDRRSFPKPPEKRVLLPILGAPYGEALESGELTLFLDRSGFGIAYYGTRLPLALKSTLRVLSARIETMEETYGADSPAFRELMGVIGAIERLPEPSAQDPAASVVRIREEEEIKQDIWRLYRSRPEVRSFLDGNIRIFNGTEGDPESFDRLDRLLSEQNYRLSYWRLANEEINYRRFFAISELIGLRVEDFGVFSASHDFVLRLVSEGSVTGLRIDHIDGLYDPLGYLATLQERIGPANPDANAPKGFYVVVEKILREGEPLPQEWPVSGTTGYDFLNTVNGVFISARGARELDEIYARFLGWKMDFDEVVYRNRKLVMETHFAGEMFSLGKLLAGIAEQSRYGRDLPRRELRQGLIEVSACFPVYRSYVRSDDISARDRLCIGRALREARRRGQETSAPVYEFLGQVLMLESSPNLSGEQKEERVRFLMRWQQYTGPIMAKGLEDTALYVYQRLCSANEVGGNPASPAVSPGEFHRRCGEALARFPHGLNASSTHDTKRSEDVRARIDVLSELPEEWEKRLVRWGRWNAGKKRIVAGRPVPDANEEILLYQTLLGAWPLDEDEIPSFRERVADYMIKAVREAKVHTHWDRPKPSHEGAVRDFVEGILEETGGNPFLEDFLSFQEKIAHYGALNSLSQLLLKVASPGVPDFYQGTELWDFSLVDPDNRRPVDFAKRALLLDELAGREAEGARTLVRELVSRWKDGRIKLFLTRKALNFRRVHSDLFLSGTYVPLPVSGGKKEHVIAFARVLGRAWAIAAVPRLATRLVSPGEFPLGHGAWGARGGLLLPEGSPDMWSDAVTGEVVRSVQGKGRKFLHLSDVFREFPAALLSGEAE